MHHTTLTNLLLKIGILLLEVGILLLEVGIPLLEAGPLLLKVGILLLEVGIPLLEAGPLLLKVGILLLEVGILTLKSAGDLFELCDLSDETHGHQYADNRETECRWSSKIMETPAPLPLVSLPAFLSRTQHDLLAPVGGDQN